jgi:predicted amidophosphoribosyltransferase
VSAHDGALRHAIARYKYRGERWLADVFAAMIGRHLVEHATWFEEFGAVTAVPAYRGRGAARDWDPVATILERLDCHLEDGCEVIPAAVEKIAETPRMQGRPWEERQQIAAGPLRRSLRPGPGAGEVAGRRILLLDDVMTEGSTMREVAGVLRRAGAREVAGLVLARPKWSEPAVRP